MSNGIHLSNPGRLAVWTIKTQTTPESVDAKAPEEHGSGAESVFEPDLREVVYVDDYKDGGKYRSIVKIHSCFVDEAGTERWTMGTGWLVRPDLVVTAGHNVWSNKFGGQSAKIKCWVGYHGRKSARDKNNVQHRSARNVVTTESWINQSPDRRLRDVAFIQVDKAFDGNLNVFSFVNTPPRGDKLNLGVVGYPGDKYPANETTDKGGQMFEEFAKNVSYDLNKTSDHMVEYLINTYGGQSGAPVLWKQPETGKLVAIGTHCYGNGSDRPNAGNPIGGEYGNNYAGIQSLLQVGSRDLWGKTFKLVDIKPSEKSDDHEESFWSVFREVAKVGAVGLSTAGSFFGPVGTLVGAATGGLLNVVARVGEGAESAAIENLGEPATSRALLAEATLQSVIRLGRSSDSEEVFDKMKRIWADQASDVAGLSHVFGPMISDCGFHITSEHWMKQVNPDPSTRKVLAEASQMTLEEAGGTTNTEFIQCLFEEGLMPLEGEKTDGEESIVSWTGNVLEKALAFAKPIATKTTKKLLKDIIDGLEQSTEAELVNPEPDQHGIQAVLRRTMMADCALQALEEIAQESKDKLKILKLYPTDAGQEEGLIASIKTRVQKIGPVALKYGKMAFKKYLPVILKVVRDHLDAKPNGESASHLSRATNNAWSKKTATTYSKLPRAPAVVNGAAPPVVFGAAPPVPVHAYGSNRHSDVESNDDYPLSDAPPPGSP